MARSEGVSRREETAALLLRTLCSNGAGVPTLDYPSPHFRFSNHSWEGATLPRGGDFRAGVPAYTPYFRQSSPSNREDVYTNEKSEPQIVLWADHTLLSTGDWRHDKLDLQASQQKSPGGRLLLRPDTQLRPAEAVSDIVISVVIVVKDKRHLTRLFVLADFCLH